MLKQEYSLCNLVKTNCILNFPLNIIVLNTNAEVLHGPLNLFSCMHIGVLKHLVNASIAPTKDFCVQQNHKVMANLSMSNAMTYKRIYLKKSRRLTAQPTKPLNDHSGFFYEMIITHFLCQKKERHFYTSLSKSGINGTKTG